MLLNELASQTPVFSTLPMSMFFNQTPYETSPLNATSDMPIKGKLGLCGGEKVDLTDVKSDFVGWFYSYNTWPHSDDQIKWANDNKMEFVPMIGYHDVKFTNYTSACELSGYDAQGKVAKKCTVDQIVADLKLTQSKLDVQM